MTTTQQEQQQQRRRQYVLVPAVYGRDSTGRRKLHWVIAEKRKSGSWFLKGRPVRSLCEKRAARIVEDYREVPKPKMRLSNTDDPLSPIVPIYTSDYFMQYEPRELLDELKSQARQRYEKRKRRHIFGSSIPQVIMKPSIDDLKEKMWCKQCLQKKKELYPDL
jgi:hypothetical protein